MIVENRSPSKVETLKLSYDGHFVYVTALNENERVSHLMLCLARRFRLLLLQSQIGQHYVVLKFLPCWEIDFLRSNNFFKLN